jgi:hypothetical protein
MTMLVEVDISVTLLVRMEANASGIKSFEGDIRARRANPMTAGTNTAVAAVLLMKAESNETASIIITASRIGLFPP